MDLNATEKRDAILEEALEVAPEQLESFLDIRCGVDSELKDELRRLLGARARMKGDFLEGSAFSWTLPMFTAGAKLGRYEIEDVISPGGMSIVYRARDLGIEREVAIKVLMPSGPPGKEDAQSLAEVKMLGGIRHPNVVQIFDYGTLHGVPYIVMEYLKGEDLARTISSCKCGDLKWKLEVARQVATALQEVHRSGIVHRDVKPANVFVEQSGSAKLMDFGISRFDKPGVTRTAALVGTPEYLSPEHVRGEPATHLSDIYSYGILLFELFAERKAFQGNTAELLYQVVHKEVPLELLRDRTVPKAIIGLIKATTEKNPSHRPPNLEEVLRHLDTAAVGRNRSTSILATRVKALLTVIFVVVLGLWTLRAINEKKQEVSPLQTDPSQKQVVAQDTPTTNHQDTAVAKSEPVREHQREERQSEAARKSRASATTMSSKGKATDNGPRPSDMAHSTERQPAPPREAASTPAEIQLPPFRPPQDTFLEIPASPIQSVGPAQSVEKNSEKPKIAPVNPGESSAQPSASTETKRTTAKAFDSGTAKREVLNVLQNFAAAYTAKDIGKVSSLFPAMTEADRRKLGSAFAVARSVVMQLSPHGEPEINSGPDGTPTVAVVRCKRLVQMTPFSGRAPKPQADTCVFRLERLRGSWVILTQRSP